MKYILFVILCLSILSCTDNSSIPMDPRGREDFNVFHNKFYTDSLFQLQRIEFPMLGLSPNGEEQFIWTLENWQYLKPVIADGRDIDRQVVDMDNVMQERMLIQGKFMIQLMYALVDNKWYLTNYSGIRDAAYFSRRKRSTSPTSIEEEDISTEEPTINLE